METQSSFDDHIASQTCLYCAQKDDMLRKYEKLVELLKKRLKRSNSVAMFTIPRTGSSENSNVIRDISNEMTLPTNSCLIDKFNTSMVRLRKSVSQTIEPRQKIVESRQETRESRISEQSLIFATAPSGFNTDKSKKRHKKISLSTQWIEKFTQLNKKLAEKQQRVNLLIDQVFRLKNEYLYIRIILMNFLRSLRVHEYFKKQAIDSKVKDIINLIFHIFQYSEQEREEIFELCSAGGQRISNRMNENKQVYLAKS